MDWSSPGFLTDMCSVQWIRFLTFPGGGAFTGQRLPVGFRVWSSWGQFPPSSGCLCKKVFNFFFRLKVVAMSNNNASNNLIIAQRAVKQLRLEASIRRIKVRTSQRWHTNTEDRASRWMAETKLAKMTPTRLGHPRLFSVSIHFTLNANNLVSYHRNTRLQAKSSHSCQLSFTV